jgi:hypothetical protein
VTIVRGLDAHEIDLTRLASEFNSSLACGGTTHEDAIELQGNHRARIDAVLAENGLKVRYRPTDSSLVEFTSANRSFSTLSSMATVNMICDHGVYRAPDVSWPRQVPPTDLAP